MSSANFNLHSFSRGVACSAATSKVPNSASSFTVLAANDARAGFILENDAAGAAVKVKLGADAATDDYSFSLAAGARYECPGTAVHMGIITAIAASASGALRVTELTPAKIDIGF